MSSTANSAGRPRGRQYRAWLQQSLGVGEKPRHSSFHAVMGCALLTRTARTISKAPPVCVVRLLRIQLPGAGGRRYRAVQEAALLSQPDRQDDGAHDRACRAFDGDGAGADVEGVFRQFGFITAGPRSSWGPASAGWRATRRVQQPAASSRTFAGRRGS